MNPSQVRSASSFGTLPPEAERAVARAGANRLVRIGVVILSSAVFSGWMSRHQSRHLHITSIQQAAGDTGKQNQRQSGYPGTVEEFEHVSSC